MYKSLTSTNDVLKTMAEDGAPEWTVVIAEEQTAGKGRMGRSFYSPGGTGIYLSILLRPKFPAQQALLITTAAAVAVARALEECGSSDVKIKWVNDVFSCGKKVSGILTEGSFDFETGLLNYAVLGIGINVATPEGGFPESISGVAGAAFSGDDVMRSRIIAKVIDNFNYYYQNIIDKPHLDGYRSRSLLTGRQVTVPAQNGSRQAQVLEVDDDFRLVVRYDDGSVEELSSGEVSVKLTQ
jgi:BirA family biotin operon repressor/biotin-[acetyl-CoA-carboxylase] ligase